MYIYPKKSIFLVFGSLIALVFLVFFVKFLFNNKEGVWTCENNKWIAQGKPTYQKPEDPCGKKGALPKAKDECISIGGIWKKMGPDPFETCNVKALDRGTICTDNSECEGWCQAGLTHDQLSQGMKGKLYLKGRGQCSVWRVELGCFGMLEKGTIKVICID